MQEMVGKIQKATVGLFEGILQSRSNVSISGIRVFKRLAVHERLWSHRGKYKKKTKKTLWILSCSGLLHAFHELQEL